MPAGRPSSYTKETADIICNGLMDGKSLRTICAVDGMPDMSTVLRWLRVNDEFYKQYTRARDIQAEVWADELIDIADDGSNDYMTIKRGDEEVEVANHEHIQRSRLRVDTRKWTLSKVLPKKYGDKTEVTLKDNTGFGDRSDDDLRFFLKNGEWPDIKAGAEHA